MVVFERFGLPIGDGNSNFAIRNYVKELIMNKRLITTLFVLVIASVAAFAGGQDENDDSATPMLDGYQSATAAGVTVQWMVDETMLNVQVSAPTDGWIAVGFDPTNKMKDANIIIGFVKDGVVMLRDDYGIGQVRHGADVDNGGTDNLSNVEGGETDGATTIRFTIPLDSGDALDKVLVPGQSYKMIAAQGSKDDFGTIHAKRGSVEIIL